MKILINSTRLLPWRMAGNRFKRVFRAELTNGCWFVAFEKEVVEY
jgi:hypothetical protein